MVIKPQSAKVRWKGLYRQAKTPEDYLAQRTQKSRALFGCWYFTGPLDRDGYGQVHHSRVSKELSVTRAHQMAWVSVNGPIPKGLVVCHSCDNPTCVNPSHLFLGTVADNNEDKRLKGRQKSGSKPTLDYAYIVSQHMKKSSTELAKELGCSFAQVCYVWRKAGLKGRNH